MGAIEDVYNTIVNGKVDDAPKEVEKALEAGKEVGDILSNGLIAAMDLVGEQFGNGDLFIPQVLWSAKAMQAGMDILKPHFSEAQQADRKKVVIGTIKGDIHDIGKNLVGMMLEGSGFDVIDLEMDVAPEAFIGKAIEENADIVAMSALLTTTMVSMKDVVDLKNEKGLSDLKIMVGGAPVDDHFRKEIGADAYGSDALEAVKIAKKLCKA